MMVRSRSRGATTVRDTAPATPPARKRSCPEQGRAVCVSGERARTTWQQHSRQQQGTTGCSHQGLGRGDVIELVLHRLHPRGAVDPGAQDVRVRHLRARQQHHKPPELEPADVAVAACSRGGGGRAGRAQKEAQQPAAAVSPPAVQLLLLVSINSPVLVEQRHHLVRLFGRHAQPQLPRRAVHLRFSGAWGSSHCSGAGQAAELPLSATATLANHGIKTDGHPLASVASRRPSPSPSIEAKTARMRASFDCTYLRRVCVGGTGGPQAETGLGTEAALAAALSAACTQREHPPASYMRMAATSCTGSLLELLKVDALGGVPVVLRQQVAQVAPPAGQAQHAQRLLRAGGRAGGTGGLKIGLGGEA